MVREIVKDEKLLSEKSTYINPKDAKQLVTDLLDTAEAHGENCAGLAANQIGELKRVFVAKIGGKFQAFLNPRIIQKSKMVLELEEGCLSLEGVRKVKRHYSIMLLSTTINGKVSKHVFNGFEAQVIQHEMQHLEGELI